MRTTLFTLALAVAVPAHAQTDPVATAQGQILSATARGYAERDAARLRRGDPPRTTAQRRHEADCARLWKLREGMTRSERVRLYDLCPR
ncbi:hypothetical protein QLH51_12000 [Sphingomonas sp. 2R-10]|uniref:hypothetical protein n=1 Tax=Sphingomonas sp. 2R-10 TaxID=3045148 RepID=UPI000F776B4C|nr:hypothetical protein [Sphingomonas sp. 2R-10]MDJ0277517.1 hypothetical protein [Sphingomonas sp. 2R-10]